MSELVELIDRANEEDAENGFRNHLGGSLIGRKCERELWYTFRFASVIGFKGRMLRLFARGQREEAQFVSYLRRIGANVREYSERLIFDSHFAIGDGNPYSTQPWEEEVNSVGGWTDVTHLDFHVQRAKSMGVNLKQWRILDVEGHFGGSLDGIIDNLPHSEISLDEELVCEFKTHGTKSFSDLAATKSVRISKPQHWAQMQVYMKKRGLRYALYMAVNKNDDDLYTELVAFDDSEATKLIDKARRVIYAVQPPNRLSNNPSFYDCKYCDHLKICHYSAPMHKTCRSCVNVSPAPNGEWHCKLWNAIIPSDYVLKGCDNYKAITD